MGTNMKMLEKIRGWGSQHPKLLSYLRIALGLILVWKGIAFTSNLDVLAHFLRVSGLTDQIGASVSITLIAQLIIILHLFGGVCIALGIHTRLFCLLNLPALIGAVLLVNLRQNISKPYFEFWLSLIVLLAIVFFLIEGDEPDVEPDTKKAIE
ncbi:MAG: DoxX family protein [Mucilaginibacter sp.]|jgi:putative oxidoreductase|nr:DoxX family protein [Mucilaginibacter sp.]MDB5017286.1 DoxX family protein [Mucilaginibacter sp.]